MKNPYEMTNPFLEFSRKNAPLENLTICRCAVFVQILGSNIQDFFQDFLPKQYCTSFSQTQGYQLSDQ